MRFKIIFDSEVQKLLFQDFMVLYFLRIELRINMLFAFDGFSYGPFLYPHDLLTAVVILLYNNIELVTLLSYVYSKGSLSYLICQLCPYSCTSADFPKRDVMRSFWRCIMNEQGL